MYPVIRSIDWPGWYETYFFTSQQYYQLVVIQKRKDPGIMGELTFSIPITLTTHYLSTTKPKYTTKRIGSLNGETQ